MTRKYRVLLLIGAMAGFAILASVYFRSERAPSEGGNASSMREYYLERTGDQPAQTPQTLEAKVEALLEERRQLDETVWAQEVAAQQHEQTIVKYWDQMLRPEDDKYAVLAKFPFQSITLDTPGETIELDWGIKKTTSGGQGKTLDQAEWREFLRDMENRGYAIDAIEFHQSEFDLDSDGSAVSVFDVLLNVANEDTAQRWTIQTKLRIEWTGETDDEGR